jgi:1-acyl-sn-glycerol-3-phosphate acyltransferase
MGSSSNAPSESRPLSGLLIPPEELARPWHKILLNELAGLGLIIFRGFFRMQVSGLENIPSAGPLFVTTNHLSVMDIPTLGALMIQRGWEPGVNMFTISKQELFQKPILPRLMSILGMFPVYRNQIDLNAMRTMITILKRHAALGIAPEGTRSPTGHLQLFQPGVAKLVIQKRVPILPVGLVGMEKVLPIGARFPRRVPIAVHFGPVYELTEYYDKELTPELVERAAWEMRARVAALLPEWMRELPPADAQARTGSVLAGRQADTA